MCAVQAAVCGTQLMTAQLQGFVSLCRPMYWLGMWLQYSHEPTLRPILGLCQELPTRRVLTGARQQWQQGLKAGGVRLLHRPHVPEVAGRGQQPLRSRLACRVLLAGAEQRCGQPEHPGAVGAPLQQLPQLPEQSSDASGRVPICSAAAAAWCWFWVVLLQPMQQPWSKGLMCGGYAGEPAFHCLDACAWSHDLGDGRGSCPCKQGNDSTAV